MSGNLLFVSAFRKYYCSPLIFADLIKRLKDAGVVCVPTCGNARHAEKAEQLGADLVIVQGVEGGGHTGSVPTSLIV